MVELKSPAEIEKMRVTGQFVAEVLGELEQRARIGVNLLELEAIVRERIHAARCGLLLLGLLPSFGRGPFRNTVCLSVNDAVLHGLPFDYTLRDGDVLTMDLAVSIDGWVADSAVTIIIGTPDPEDTRLVHATREALDAAIAVALPGNTIGALSAAIAAVADANGYPINTEFGGHGLGRTMHEDPRLQPRPPRPRLPPAPRPHPRHRTLVRPHHRPRHHRPRRLDPALRRRLPHRPLRTHPRHHRLRPPDPHPHRMNPRATASKPRSRRTRDPLRSVHPGIAAPSSIIFCFAGLIIANAITMHTA